MEPRSAPSSNRRIKRSPSSQLLSAPRRSSSIATTSTRTPIWRTGAKRHSNSDNNWLLVAFIAACLVPLYLNAVAVAQGECLACNMSSIYTFSDIHKHLDKQLKNKRLYQKMAHIYNRKKRRILCLVYIIREYYT